MLTNFDFLYDDEAEDVSWGPEYEDRRLSYCSLDVGSLERDMKSNLQTLECLSGSEQDLTPHDSSDDEDEVLLNWQGPIFLFEVYKISLRSKKTCSAGCGNNEAKRSRIMRISED